MLFDGGRAWIFTPLIPASTGSELGGAAIKSMLTSYGGLDQWARNPSYLTMPIDPEKLVLDVKGATADEIERGLVAAFAVFERAGATPCEAAVARFKRDGETEELKIERQRSPIYGKSPMRQRSALVAQGWVEIPSDAQIMLAQK
jgi:hypothetical protein